VALYAEADRMTKRWQAEHPDDDRGFEELVGADDGPFARNPSTGFPDFRGAPTCTMGGVAGWEDMDHGD